MINQSHRFQVTTENFGSQTSYKLIDTETGEYCRVLPYLGGTVNNVVIRQHDKLTEILDGYTTDENAAKNLTSSFKGSNLFPFPNRISDGAYTHLDKNYQLDINFPNEKNAIHGLVFDKNFELISKDNGDVSCSLVILYSPKELPAGYPFKYTLEVEYRWLKYALFECTSKVINHSDRDIPVGIGWHPYFIADADSVDDLWLQFPSETMLDVNERMIPTGKSKIFNDFSQLRQISGSNFDSCFTLSQEKSPAEIVIFNKKKNFGYKIWQETGTQKFNYLQVYTPPTRKSIAIEPMTCIPDAFNNKEGLISLKPGKSVVVKWGISTIN